MQVAIAVGTMLLGSWVLNTPVEEELMDEEQQWLMTEGEPGPSPMPATKRTEQRTERERRADWDVGGFLPDREKGQMRRSRSSQSRQQQSMMQQRQALVMPNAPTEGGAQGMRGQPSAPTSAASELGPGMYGTRTPSAPTSQRRSRATYRPTSHTPEGRMRPTQASSGTALRTQQSMSQQGVASPGSNKIFGNYRATSGISPYMNLFRGGTALGTIDNYTSLVRPELEQRYMNQQVNRDLVGLERNTRMQQMQMQMLNQQRQRSLQGVGTPQFYMNYGGYYQSGQ